MVSRQPHILSRLKKQSFTVWVWSFWLAVNSSRYLGHSVHPFSDSSNMTLETWTIFSVRGVGMTHSLVDCLQSILELISANVRAGPAKKPACLPAHDNFFSFPHQRDVTLSLRTADQLADPRSVAKKICTSREITSTTEPDSAGSKGMFGIRTRDRSPCRKSLVAVWPLGAAVSQEEVG